MHWDGGEIYIWYAYSIATWCYELEVVARLLKVGNIKVPEILFLLICKHFPRWYCITHYLLCHICEYQVKIKTKK